MDFREQSVADLSRQLRDREVSARDVVGHALERIGALDGEVRAFVALDAEQAMAEANRVDQGRAAGDDLGPLAGIPIGVKDLEDAAGFPTTHGSALFADAKPAIHDSILVERLKSAGCIVVGKTNTPEFGWKGDTSNPTFGATHNPWKLDRSTGGSSGGSAAAVAAGMVPIATASDGGGSIRIPASVCGLPGFKPSMGRVPMGGAKAPGWPDLSVKGVLANSVADTVGVLDLVVGPDPSDLTSLPMPKQSWVDALDTIGLPNRVVWSPTLGFADVDDEVLAVCQGAVDKIAAAGVEVEHVDNVFDEDPVGAFLALSGTGNLVALGEFRDTPAWEKVDPELAFILDYASQLSAADYQRNRDVGHNLNLKLIDLFHRASFLLTPTVAGQAGPAGGVGTINGVDDANWIRMTYPFNLTRSPAGTLPVGFLSNGLPVGLQIIGPQRADIAVLLTMMALDGVVGVTHVAPLDF